MKSKQQILPEETKLTLFDTCCLLLALYLIAVRVYYVFSYNTNLEGVEFALVHFIQLICLKGNLYTDASQFPYLLVVHAPLYYYFMAAIMKLFTINVAEDIHTMYVIGRSISFLLLFVNYFILLKILQLFIVQFKFKIRLLLLLLLFVPAHFYACRPDSFKVVFFMLFLYSMIQSYKTNKLIFSITSIFFLFIGVLFKQDIIVYGCLIYFIFFLRTRKLIHIISPAIIVISVVCLMYAYYFFSGINLFKELFIYNIQYDSDIRLNIILIACHYVKAVPLLIFSVLNIKSKNKLTCMLSILSIMYFMVFSLFMLRIGSSFNYTYESVILLLLNVFIYFEEHAFKLSNLKMSLYVVLLFSVNKFIFYKIIIHKNVELNYKKAYFDNKTAAQKIKQIIGNHVVFIPDMKYYLFYAKLPIIYGADWHYDRYCSIALNIQIKPKFIRNDIVDQYDRQFINGKVEYILIENNYKSKELLRQYYTSFALDQQVNNFLIYKFNIERVIN